MSSGKFSANMTRRPFSEDSGSGPSRGTRTKETDYRFRYPVDPGPDSGPGGLQDLPAEHLRAILELLTPTRQGQEVRVDGYRSLGDPDLVHSLYPEEDRDADQSAHPLDIYEPRISYIRKLIDSLQSVVEFEHQGQEVRIDGFRLKRPDQWLRPGGGAGDILAQAATRCNLNCRFCFNLGSPPALNTAPRKASEEYQEILTRIAHYVPESKLGLFPDLGSPCEMLNHPYILKILQALRRKTSEVLRIPTNGSNMTPKMIRALKPLQPLFIDVSLNSSASGRRGWLMGDPKPEVAINALAELRSTLLPYSVIIVPWPFPSLEKMTADLEQTIFFSARFDPAFIQISLPGYSNRFSQEVLFDREEVWNRVKDEVHRLRTVTDCPLILRPGLFEEYQDPEAVDSPRLSGVIKNSPAALAGLRRGDWLLKLNGLAVKNRPQALSLLKMIRGSRLEKIPLTVGRSGGSIDLTMDLKAFDYPFDPRTAPYAGCIFPSAGIPLEWIEQLRQRIRLARAREVLLLSSTLVRPTLEKRIGQSLYLSEVNLHLRVPANRYLGGNIFMGDLLVVEDFMGAVQDFLDEEKGRPDLIILPSSPFHLSGWGRDLTGRVYKDIERRFGIPVGLIACDPIFD